MQSANDIPYTTCAPNQRCMYHTLITLAASFRRLPWKLMTSGTVAWDVSVGALCSFDDINNSE